MRGQERTRKEAVQEREQNLRETRIPVSGPRDILTVYGKDPNFVYRFVNDDGNRVARFLRGGWEIVTDDLEVGVPRVGVPEKDGSPVSYAVGRGLNAYLMRIKKEWYDEDQARKQDAIEESEKVMLNEHKQPGMYGDVEKFRTVGK